MTHFLNYTCSKFNMKFYFILDEPCLVIYMSIKALDPKMQISKMLLPRLCKLHKILNVLQK